MNLTDAQWGTLVTWAITVGGFIVVEWRAARNRRWAKEDRALEAVQANADRERNAKEAIAAREAATAEIIARAAAEAEATRIKTETIADQLRRHTELTAAQLREEARIGADALVQEAAVIAARLETKTTAQIEEQRQTGAELAKKVTEATVAAKDAYREANHVNVKIEDLNQRLMQVAKVPAATEQKLEKIDQTTERIEDKVDADGKP